MSVIDRAKPQVNAARTYVNPVHNHSFPDPYVLKFRGEYFAYCTGFSPDGRVFGVLNSRDLVNWTELAGAMTPLKTGGPLYWAPEVTYHNGRFYLYYSTGNEILMELRVAVSDRADDGFEDAGKKLTFQDFAIDAHVFRDDDGTWYMFYATDFLEYSHIGTGTVVDRMLDPFTLEGNPRPVTRARYDWQVYEPERKEKGGVRWHTVEGPFVLKRKGLYFEMFSGGNWQNISYGVSFAITDDIRRNEEWQQNSDGEKTLPIMRTIPERVIGPGHNSVIRGPNNRELYCVYHRWENNQRVLAIDRMDFLGDRIFVIGPTDMPQLTPYKPQLSENFEDLSGGQWKILSGEWKVSAEELIAGSDSHAGEIVCDIDGKSFLAELCLRATGDGKGEFGVSLRSAAGEIFRVFLIPAEKRASAVLCGIEERALSLTDQFDFSAIHELRLEVDDRTLSFSLDNAEIKFSAILSESVSRLGLFSDDLGAAFSAFAVTLGFEDRFENGRLEDRGWRPRADAGTVDIRQNFLRLAGKDGGKVTGISREVPSGDFELCLNFRLQETSNAACSFTVKCGNSFTLKKSDGWMLHVEGRRLRLPAKFDPSNYVQLRFICRDGETEIWFENERLGTSASNMAKLLELFVQNTTAEFDMVRYTVL